jgi:signal transduction histidine kinase
LSADEISKLFKEFVRIKNPKTKDILGSGLGLSTVKKIAEIYNGTCSVQSKPDVGSTFIVTLFEQ